MNSASASSIRGDPVKILDRHASRRIAGVPTVSVLVGAVGAGAGTWRRWASATSRGVIVAHEPRFPTAEWLRSVAEQVDLPAAAVKCLARRAERDPTSLLGAWCATTVADRERLRQSLTPSTDDDLLFTLATLAIEPHSGNAVAAVLSGYAERSVTLLVRLIPSAPWPGVLFVAHSGEELSTIGAAAVPWAMSVPAIPIAVAVPADIWTEFRTSAPESRVKALLREGETTVSGHDPGNVARELSEAGITEGAVAALAAMVAEATLVQSAIVVARATAIPPTTQADDDHARSAAERFLFAFLEALPETAGRFTLNATLDFPFGPRPAEVDLLCRSPRLAIELDGYFHFLGTDNYRRDRAKDWQLQRRGYVVLRFLAEDVIPQLELIRDRILDALTVTSRGGPP